MQLWKMCLATAHIWPTLFVGEQKKPQRGEKTPWELCTDEKKIWKIPQAFLRKHGGNTAAEYSKPHLKGGQKQYNENSQ